MSQETCRMDGEIIKEAREERGKGGRNGNETPKDLATIGNGFEGTERFLWLGLGLGLGLQIPRGLADPECECRV